MSAENGGEDMARPPKVIRDDIVRWLEMYLVEYSRIWDRLDKVRQNWSLTSYRGKEAMLQMSFTYALATQQVPLSEAERVFDRIMNGQTVTAAYMGESFNTRRPQWMYRSISDSTLWMIVLNALLDGDNMTALDRLAEDAVGLRAKKASFALAQLGFTQEMCVDGNISDLISADIDTKIDIPQYRRVCANIQRMFPELTKRVREPYHLQWVLFDYQRHHRINASGTGVVTTDSSPVATQDKWFEWATGNPARIVRRMDRLEREADRALDNG